MVHLIFALTSSCTGAPNEVATECRKLDNIIMDMKLTIISGNPDDSVIVSQHQANISKINLLIPVCKAHFSSNSQGTPNSWVGLRSDHVPTTDLWTGPRPSPLKGLGCFGLSIITVSSPDQTNHTKEEN